MPHDPHWITDWSEIDADERYLVCPIAAAKDGTTYLQQPAGIRQGWEVKRLMPRCYAALLLPAWGGLPPKEFPHV